MPKLRSAADTLHIHKLASANGKRLSAATVEWSVAGDCTSPPLIEVNGRRTYDRATLVVSPTNFTDLHVRCRKCPNCLRAKARHWAARAAREIERAGTTFFVTYTLRPDAHCHAQFRADLAGRGDWSGLVAEEYKLLQLAHKRMRKAGHNFRFLAVAEAHKSGLPHWHVLYHQVFKTFTTRLLAGNHFEGLPPSWWPHGHVNARLVHDDQAPGKVSWYVCKYITKSPDTKMRPSLNYGL